MVVAVFATHAHSALASWVASGLTTVLAVQRAAGIVDGKPTNPLLHAAFTAGAALGNELFFITFLPLFFWEGYYTIGRRVILLWGTQYYVGQLLKELLQLPRPDPRLVAQLETHYAIEYGLPSTHAMNAVAMPWYILSLLHGAGGLAGWAHPAATLAAIAWTVLCTGSRLYMGVHTPADIMAGLALGAASLALHVAYGGTMDAALMGWTLTPLAIVVALIVLVVVYPRPASPRWVSSPGDTTIILGVTAGVVVGCWVAARLGGGDNSSGGGVASSSIVLLLPSWVEACARFLSGEGGGKFDTTFSSAVSPLDSEGATPLSSALRAVGRTLAGFIFLFATRAVVKGVCVPLFTRLVGPAWMTPDEAASEGGGGGMHAVSPSSSGVGTGVEVNTSASSRNKASTAFTDAAAAASGGHIGGSTSVPTPRSSSMRRRAHLPLAYESDSSGGSGRSVDSSSSNCGSDGGSDGSSRTSGGSAASYGGGSIGSSRGENDSSYSRTDKALDSGGSSVPSSSVWASATEAEGTDVSPVTTERPQLAVPPLPPTPRIEEGTSKRPPLHGALPPPLPSSSSSSPAAVVVAAQPLPPQPQQQHLDRGASSPSSSASTAPSADPPAPSLPSLRRNSPWSAASSVSIAGMSPSLSSPALQMLLRVVGGVGGPPSAVKGKGAGGGEEIGGGSSSGFCKPVGTSSVSAPASTSTTSYSTTVSDGTTNTSASPPNHDVTQGSTIPKPTAGLSVEKATAFPSSLHSRVPIPPGKRYAIELPTKALTYAAIGINTVLVWPLLRQRWLL